MPGRRSCDAMPAKVVKPIERSEANVESGPQPDTEATTEDIARKTPRVSEALDIVRRVCNLGDYDSNVIGMAAEIIAEDVFGMKKVSRGRRDIDGVWLRDGALRTVQVKAWSERRVGRYRANTYFDVKESTASEDLLVLLIYSSRVDYKVIYRGLTRNIGNISTSGVQRRVHIRSMLPPEDLHNFLKEFPIPPHGNG